MTNEDIHWRTTTQDIIKAIAGSIVPVMGTSAARSLAVYLAWWRDSTGRRPL